MSNCPNLEQLIAYHTKEMQSKDVENFEKHLSGCSRCSNIIEFLNTIDEAGKGLYCQSIDPSTECLTHEELAAYVENRTEDKEKEKIEKHLAECTACAGELSVLKECLNIINKTKVPQDLIQKAREIEEELDKIVALPQPKTSLGWNRQILAAAAVLLLGFISWVTWHSMQGPDAELSTSPKVQISNNLPGEEFDWQTLALTGQKPEGPVVLNVRTKSDDPIFDLIEETFSKESTPDNKISGLLKERYGVSTPVKSFSGLTPEAAQILSVSPQEEKYLWINLSVDGNLWIESESSLNE